MRRFPCLLALLPAVCLADLQYTVSPNPNSKSIVVEITVPDAKNPEFRIPAWCPGFYFLQSYEKKISDVKAVDESGRSLTVRKADTRGWKVESAGGIVKFSYSVKGDDAGLGFFGTNVRDDKAFINGPSALMYVEGRLAEAAKLSLNLPSGWDVATGMAKNGDHFEAGGYDELIDHPIQMGKFIRESITVNGYPVDVVFVAINNEVRCDTKKEAARIQTLLEPAITMFGELPQKRYVVLLHLAIGSFSGGLEHRASTCIAIPNGKPLNIDTLLTHEYFHTWNVKHIRPAILGPFDYKQECRTANLWFAEGVTDYYANVTAYRTKFHDSSWLIDVMSEELQVYMLGSERKKTSLADACKQTWEFGGFGKRDLDYYNAGLLAGLMLDCAIRGATQGSRSLDDVLKKLYASHKLPQAGYPEDGILKAVNEVAGKDLSNLYRTMIQTTDEWPFAATMNEIGLRVRVPGTEVPDLGYVLNGKMVDAVQPELGQSGLQAGDELLTINGEPFGPNSISNLVSKNAAVLRYDLQFKRNGEISTISLPLLKTKVEQWRIEVDPFASPEKKKLLEGWLSR